MLGQGLPHEQVVDGSGLQVQEIGGHDRGFMVELHDVATKEKTNGTCITIEARC